MKDKKYSKVRDHCHYKGEYEAAVHSKCNLKYSVPKNISIVFHNGSNYDYFIIKELAEELQKQFTCLGEIHNLYSSNGKKVIRIEKMDKKLLKIYLAYYNSVIVRDLW